MSDFDPSDDDLGLAIRNRAPDMATTSLGTAHAHDAVLARARGIRRRRAGLAGLATLIVVVGSAAWLLNGGNGDDTLAPATEPSTSLSSETSAAPTTSALPTTSAVPRTSVTEPSASTSTTPSSPTTTVSVTVRSTAPGSTVAAPPPATVGGQANPTGPPASSTTSSTSSSSSSSTSSSTSPAPQGPAPFTKTYSSAGGSITISWNGSALSLDAVNPAAGETSEIEDNSATRIRVRFRGEIDSRIEIRVENGQVTERID